MLKRGTIRFGSQKRLPVAKETDSAGRYAALSEEQIRTAGKMELDTERSRVLKETERSERNDSSGFQVRDLRHFSVSSVITEASPAPKSPARIIQKTNIAVNLLFQSPALLALSDNAIVTARTDGL